MVSALKSGTFAEYAYDAGGCRRSKKVNGVETLYLSAGDEEIAEYTSAGVLLRRYVPGPGTDMPVAMVTPQSGGAQEVKYIHADRQGSVLALSSATGALVVYV